MTRERQAALGAFGLALGIAALCLILILTALHAVGTDDALYFRLQTEAGILPESGISEGDLRTLDAALAHSLAGSPDELMTPLENEPGEYAVLALNVDRKSVV